MGDDCQDDLFLSKIVRQYFEISGFLFSHSDQNYAAYLLLKGARSLNLSNIVVFITMAQLLQSSLERK